MKQCVKVYRSVVFLCLIPRFIYQPFRNYYNVTVHLNTYIYDCPRLVKEWQSHRIRLSQPRGPSSV